MRITAEISMYPLQEDFVEPIRDFIGQLRQRPGLDIMTNQMSTQLRGDFNDVTSAIADCMRESMEHSATISFVVKYLNADLPIDTRPAV